MYTCIYVSPPPRPQQYTRLDHPPILLPETCTKNRVGLPLSLYIYIFKYNKYTYIYIDIYTYVYTDTKTYTCMYIYLTSSLSPPPLLSRYMHICIYAYTYIYTRTDVYLYINRHHRPCGSTRDSTIRRLCSERSVTQRHRR